MGQQAFGFLKVCSLNACWNCPQSPNVFPFSSLLYKHVFTSETTCKDCNLSFTKFVSPWIFQLVRDAGIYYITPPLTLLSLCN